MGWLADAAGLPPGADPLTLQPRTYALWLEALGRTRAIVEPSLLALARARIARLHGLPPPPDAAASGASGERDAAALDYLEQLVVDQSALTEEQKRRLGRQLPPRELADFTYAAYAHDADLRMRALLGIEVDSSEREVEPVPPGGDGTVYPFPHADAAFSEALGRFGNDASRRSLVDPATTEVCRLRNAWYQRCET